MQRFYRPAAAVAALLSAGPASGQVLPAAQAPYYAAAPPAPLYMMAAPQAAPAQVVEMRPPCLLDRCLARVGQRLVARGQTTTYVVRSVPPPLAPAPTLMLVQAPPQAVYQAPYAAPQPVYAMPQAMPYAAPQAAAPPPQAAPQTSRAEPPPSSEAAPPVPKAGGSP